MVMAVIVTKTQQVYLYPEELPSRSRRGNRKGKRKGKKGGENRETGGDSLGRKEQKVQNNRKDGVNIFLMRPLHAWNFQEVKSKNNSLQMKAFISSVKNKST